VNKRNTSAAVIIGLLLALLAYRLLSFSGSYIAWFAPVEPLGGGSHVLQIYRDGTGKVEDTHKEYRSLVYTRSGNSLDVVIDWDSGSQEHYLFKIGVLKLVALGHRMPDGTLSKNSGYGFLMNATYWKKPI
jgi:hypothetical protein